MRFQSIITGSEDQGPPPPALMAAMEKHLAKSFGDGSLIQTGGLARIVRDVGLAEDLAQDALLAAMHQWPVEGVPHNPGAWLMGVSKHRAIDHLRRRRMLERKHLELGAELASWHESPERELDAALDDPVGDDLLGLVFTACHPALPDEARVALTLRLLGGLSTAEIAVGLT